MQAFFCCIDQKQQSLNFLFSPPSLPLSSPHTSSRAAWFVVLQIITAAELSGVETDAASTDSVSCFVCRIIPGLTPSQQNMCCDLPKAITILDKMEHTMRTECRWQLRKELWNCSEIGMPIFRAPTLQGQFRCICSIIQVLAILHDIVYAIVSS